MSCQIQNELKIPSIKKLIRLQFRKAYITMKETDRVECLKYNNIEYYLLKCKKYGGHGKPLLEYVT